MAEPKKKVKYDAKILAALEQVERGLCVGRAPGGFLDLRAAVDRARR